MTENLISYIKHQVSIIAANDRVNTGKFNPPWIIFYTSAYEHQHELLHGKQIILEGAQFTVFFNISEKEAREFLIKDIIE